MIRAHEGQLGNHLFEQALEKGTERKNSYYLGHLDAAKSPPWVYKQMALAAKTKQGDLAGILSLDEVAQLSEPARKQKEETIDEFVTNALHAGLLAPVSTFLITIVFQIRPWVTIYGCYRWNYLKACEQLEFVI